MAKPTQHPIQQKHIHGINYAYIEKGEGPLVLMIHGFPDDANAFDDSLNRLADAGYRAVAPFMRGYAPTDLAPDDTYSVKAIAEDMLQLMTELGAESAYVVGHDWGASVAYTIANIAPERVIKLMTLAIPHPRVIKPSLKLLRRASHFLVFRFFKFALWYTRRNNFAYIDRIYRKWAPTWDIPAQQVEKMKTAYAQPGRLEAAIGFYRDFFKDQGTPTAKLYVQKTSVPTLVIAGAQDGAIVLEQFEQMDRAFTGPFRWVLFENAGHFPHTEQPERFWEELIGFLQE
ncbi:MAG: alpha/beta hydrolase [Bacteroidota bacterium]